MIVKIVLVSVFIIRVENHNDRNLNNIIRPFNTSREEVFQIKKETKRTTNRTLFLI